MQEPPSTAADSTVWIFLAGILLLAAAIGFISLGIMSHNQTLQSQSAAQPATTTAPAPAAAPAK